MTYYWEGQKLRECGQFEADSDVEALLKVKQDWVIVYRENEDSTRPEYVTIYHNPLQII
jgi:hypothetical protein